MDPRVVEGTSWVTGANAVQRHVLDLVMGRDFTADGTIEAAEILPGDPAPDGSGPLQLARGIEIGHIFALGRKYSRALGLSVLDENGKAQVVTMGSYGIGVSRMDYYTRGNIKNLNNPNIWMNEKITDKIMLKAILWLWRIIPCPCWS